MIVEFRGGKIWRDTRYYAEPFEAPAWRVSGSSGWRNPAVPASAAAGRLSAADGRIGARWS